MASIHSSYRRQRHDLLEHHQYEVNQIVVTQMLSETYVALM